MRATPFSSYERCPIAYTTDSASNRLLAISGGRSLGYDAAGNTIADSGAPPYTAEYDASNRLTGLRVTAGASGGAPGGMIGPGGGMGSGYTYAYNDRGQRVRKEWASGGSCSGFACTSYYGGRSWEQYLYDPQGHLLAQHAGSSLSASGTPAAEYVWLGDTPIAVIKPDDSATGGSTAQIYFIHADHLDTPRVVLDRANNLRWTRFAEPFGTTTANDNPAGLGSFTFNLRNPGQYWDVESGLHYNWWRFYDPSIGRYVQSDPIGLAGGINTYAYVEGNPLSYADPNGLQGIGTTNSLPAVGGVCAATGGTACAAAAVGTVGVASYWLTDRYVNPWAQPMIASAIEWCTASDTPTQQECDAEWLRARNVCFECVGSTSSRMPMAVA